MRHFLLIALAALVFFQAEARTQPQDEAKAIITRAIKAMGLDKAPANIKGYRTKAKGELEIMGVTLTFSQQITVRLPNQFRDELELEANGKKIPVRTIFNGTKGSVEADGKVVKLDDKTQAELRDVANLLELAQLSPLLTSKYTLSPVGEVKVDDKPALGVRVCSKGSKDLNLFFDKQTGYLTKVDRQAYDATTGQEVPEERIIQSYKDMGGRKVPHKLLVRRDGKKFLEAEITEHTPLENVDAGEFEIPK